MTTRTKNISGGNRRTVYTILLSVCLFLGVICACLLVALILIGRNIATQSLIKDCQYDNSTVTSTTTNTKNSSEHYNDIGFLSDESFTNDTSNEISVKINLNTSKDEKTTRYLSTTPITEARPGWRLPRNVKPIHYDLFFHPDLTSGLVTGKNNITIQITEPLDYIVVHGYLLNVSAAEIYSAETNEKINVINFHNDSLHQFWVVDLEDTLKPGIYYLVFDFSSMMAGKRVGMYLSNYLDQNDNRRYIATSKFEPTYARQAFPCFDEPNYKARYTVHIEKPTGDYIALSNMNVKETTDLNEKKQMVTFNTSVPMSTYVTCFIVCDFKYKETKITPSIGENITLRVYATPAQVNKTQFALEVAEKVTKYYVDYFKIEYPLPKLDMIAIPDFVSGAMEHWGLVTYRETALLFDEKTSNAANKQRVATVVAHELAHMWFGNLVTLDWWNDLWLNEGFATYMQFKAIDNILKDWGMVDQFLIDQVHPVMDFDATLASHPIVQTVATPDQITEIFDSISYNKGAAVLRMLENAIGEDKFSEGINKYLAKHKYGNAVTINLWDQLQSTNPNFVVKDVMDTWTKQMGYPVVTVTEDANHNFVLKQKRFLTDPDTATDSPTSDYNYKYTIPITYTSDVATKIDTNVWFNWTDNSVTIAKPINSTWLKINHKGSGYYRVNYPKDYWLKDLTANIQKMEVSDRASLLDDVFALAKGGELPYEIPLAFSKVLENEKSYVPWSVGIKRLTELKPLLAASKDKAGDDMYTKYKKHGQKLVKTIYKELPWEESDTETHQNNLLRGKIFNFGCSFGMDECLTKTKEKFNGWLNKNEVLPPNLKAIIYAYGMEEISTKDWDKVFTEKYMPETDAQEKMKLLSGLASTKNAILLQKLIRLAEDPNVVRSQDFFTCLQYISSNEAGTLIVWDYVKTNWQKLVDRFGLNDRYLGQLIPAITSTFTTTSKLEEMENFFNKYPEAGAGAISRKKALENVKNNIKWVNKYQDQVKLWLDLNITD